MVETIYWYLQTRYAWTIQPEWLVILPGVWPGLGLTVDAFSKPGEGVMIVTPIYPPFLEVVKAERRRLQTVPAALRGGRWRLPLDEMEAAVAPDTRVLLFSSPHNPLGRAFDEEEIAAVVDLCRRHNIVLCSDEVHCDLRLDPVQHVPSLTIDGACDVTVTFMAPSKTFNLPGLQFAFGIIPDDSLRRRFRRAGEGLIEMDMPNVMGLAAAEAAYRYGGAWLAELLNYLRGNAAMVERFVAEELPGVGTTHVEATYLAWLDCRELGLDDPAGRCLAAGVALSDGREFNGAGCLRLNFGCPRATLEEVLARTKKGRWAAEVAARRRTGHRRQTVPRSARSANGSTILSGEVTQARRLSSVYKTAAPLDSAASRMNASQIERFSRSPRSTAASASSGGGATTRALRSKRANEAATTCGMGTSGLRVTVQ
jgi:cystathionine beta-lyase